MTDTTTRLLPITELHPAPDNLRTRLTDIDELAASITSIGLLQPLVVTRREEGGWTIVAGNRRRAAGEKAGLAELECRVLDLDDTERTIVMAVENLQRTDLTPLEEADAYQRLATAGLTQRDIATRVGRNQSHVSKRLGLLELPEPARAKLDAGSITVDTAVELTKLKNDPKRLDQVVKNLDHYAGDAGARNAVAAALASAAKERKLAKIIKPLVAAGLERVATSYYKYQICTQTQATVFWFDWHDKPVFAKERSKPKAAANGADTTPKEETKKQREAREVAEAAAAARAAARARVLDGPPAADLLAAFVLDAWFDFPDDVEAEELFPMLGLPGPAADAKYATVQDELRSYIATSRHHLQRAATAVVLLAGETKYRTNLTRPRALALLADAGLELTADEQKVLADAGAHPDDQPSGKAAIAAELDDAGDFADAHQLQPGDEVHDDGSIERADGSTDGPVDDWETPLRDGIRTDNDTDITENPE